MRNALLIPYEERQNLIRVVGRIWHDASIEKPLLVELSLGFERTNVTLAVTADDEIEVPSQITADDPAIQEIDLGEMVPWRGSIGRPLIWAWVMTNQQGYSDGLQLEFAEDVEAESVIVQLIALGAQLRVRVINPKFLP